MRAIDRLWNLLTVLVLGLTGLSGLCVGAVFVNPAGIFDAIAPPRVPVLLAVPTVEPFLPAATVIVFPTLPPEWTATASPPPSVSPTRRVTATAAEPEPTRGLAPGSTTTPFPSPIGPTITPTETDVPTITPTGTRVPPTRTSTPRPYPILSTGTPSGYP